MSKLNFGSIQWLFLFMLLSIGLVATPTRNELEIGGIGEGRLTYYLEFPNDSSQPLMLILEGSFVEKAGPQSVLGLHAKLAQPILDLGIGIVTMEKHGVDGSSIDASLFHRFNTVSQRLNDHFYLVQHLIAHPPSNWNGQLIILGGSEGGPIAIKLADVIHPIACIVMVGCGDQAFADYIWSFIQSIPPEDGRFVDLPKDRESYERQIAMMKAHPDPTRFWLGQSYFYWADAMDQTEYEQFLRLRCPAFVVAGSEDIQCASTDRLIVMATARSQDITYLRVEGMGHKALDPKWDVIAQVLKWLHARLSLHCGDNYP